MPLGFGTEPVYRTHYKREDVVVKKKLEISSWDDLKKTREAIYEIEDFGTVKLRGITETERVRAIDNASNEIFNKVTKKYDKRLDEQEFGYRLIIEGWVEPEIPGDAYEQKKKHLRGLGFAFLQNLSLKINRLSGVARRDIEEVKNF